MSSKLTQVHHRYAEVSGHRIFYREAGPADAPTLLLLHGFPASSYMFRDVTPLLATKYHVVAPDMLGFGFSDAPPTSEFTYTFDSLTDLTVGLLAELGIMRCSIYVHDYGAPLGWRLALKHPEAIDAIITQNGNGYDEGFMPDFWASVWNYQADQNASSEAAIRQALTLDTTRWQYVTGAPDESLVSPDSWNHDYHLLSRPGNDAIQLALFLDYATNPPMYPRLHEYLRESRVPVLAVWGKDDQIFGPAGAEAFARDAVDPEIHLLAGGHFLLETAAAEVAVIIRDFLDRRVAGADAARSLRFEVMCVPVRDIDRALRFYTEQAGFTLDVDYRPDDDFRVVQLTPPGSATSIHLRLDPQRAGSLRDSCLVVSDIDSVLDALASRGVRVSSLRHKAAEDGWRGAFLPGVDEARADYATFADFSDPDGNTWLLQERGYQPAVRRTPLSPEMIHALALAQFLGR